LISTVKNLDSDWEMTVLPQPKAPGNAVVPPCKPNHIFLKTIGENEVLRELISSDITVFVYFFKIRNLNRKNSFLSQNRIVFHLLFLKAMRSIFDFFSKHRPTVWFSEL